MRIAERIRQTARIGHIEVYDAIGVGNSPTHAVQYYEDDEYLVGSVGDYLAAGMALGQPVVAIVTPAHKDALRRHLESRGFDVDRASLRGSLSLVDADELLSTFMVGSLPDVARCHASVGGLLRMHARGKPEAIVRVFGEMVDILSRAGNIEGAMQLEAFWNELALTHRFSLLCGYSMRTFGSCGHTATVNAISHAHAHVIPTERYITASESGRMTQVASLQQRAQALEAEIARREDLEHSLREALHCAESANRAKNQFLAVMSHELRTPLNAIGGHVQLMEMELLGTITDKQRDALGRVQRSQRHLLALINDVLNLARLETSQVVFASEPFVLSDLLAEVTSLLDPLFASSGLQCELDLREAGGPYVVRGDREKVHQILLNLLGNAIKFTPHGGRIVVRSRADDAEWLVRVDVTDSGIGLPEDKLEAIFEPFMQLMGGSPKPREGVGLGLSISRTLARGMHGELTAESGNGTGSTFTLTLPRA